MFRNRLTLHEMFTSWIKLKLERAAVYLYPPTSIVPFGIAMQEEYPNEPQRQSILAAEKLMKETMARYDPSHDAYHGNALSIVL